MLLTYFKEDLIHYDINSDEMKRIYRELTIPDLSTEKVDGLINDFVRLSYWEKVKFLERFEPIKSELKL